MTNAVLSHCGSLTPAASVTHRNEPVKLPVPDVRLCALDALRCGAMLLVVAAHAGMAYMQLGFPRVPWAVQDRAATPWFDWFSWWAATVTMPMFFLISGYSAVSLYRSRGPGGFFVNRAKRILVPFLVGSLVILPICFYCFAYGWLVSGRCTVKEILRTKFLASDLQSNLRGPVHLWYLEFLCLFLLAFGAVQLFRDRLGARRRRLRQSSIDEHEPEAPAKESQSRSFAGASGLCDATRRTKTDRALHFPAKTGWLERLLFSAWRPLLFAIPTTLVCWVGYLSSGFDPAVDVRNTFVPQPFRLLHYGLFFVVGTRLFSVRRKAERFVPLSWIYVLLSVPAYACKAWLQTHDMIDSLSAKAALALAASDGLFFWLSVFGFLGLFLRYCNRPVAAVSYFADASYWVYILHLPFVALVQANLFEVSAHATLKFCVSLTVPLLLSLLTYRAFVRHTFVGTWLHGHREKFFAAASS